MAAGMRSVARPTLPPAGVLGATALVALSTDGVRIQERVEFWQEMVLRLFADVEIAAGPAGSIPDRFFGRMQSRLVRDIRVTRVEAAAQTVARRHPDARAAYEDCYFAVVMTAGTQRLEQDGRIAVLGPGDFAIYDGARPHRLGFSDRWGEVIVNIPRPALHRVLPQAGRCTAVRIAGDSPLGQVLARFLLGIGRDLGRLDAAALGARADQGVGLIGGALAGLAGAADPAAPSRAATLARALAHVARNLGDPTLSPEAIGAALGRSPRYLNRLFAETGTSLMRHVWAERLDRCRADLTVGGDAPGRIGAVALRWGFNDLSHFSRAFRDRFGASPREFARGAVRVSAP